MNPNTLSRELFSSRHNAISSTDEKSMLATLGLESIDQLITETVPADIRLPEDLNLPAPLSEYEYIQNLKKIAGKNVLAKNFIGQGYYGTIVPPVILRNVFENPAWYTAYTPYQAEIAQGRLEALINYQTLVVEMTGMEIANASLLDEGTAAAEAMNMLYSLRPKEKKNAHVFVVDEQVFSQTLQVLTTRAEPLGISIRVEDLSKTDITASEIFGVYFQYPNKLGNILDYSAFCASAKENNVFISVGTDLLALTMLTPPGDWGADVVVGTSQRLGVPMGFGGPHAAFFATRDTMKRSIPGRIIGISKDSEGNLAYRMALQTREQHIKREKATSNICTAQVLLSVMSSMYAVYHGPIGLKNIALRIQRLTSIANDTLLSHGINCTNSSFFDTLTLEVENAEIIQKELEKKLVNIHVHSSKLLTFSIDETHDIQDVELLTRELISLLGKKYSGLFMLNEHKGVSGSIERKGGFLTHEVFNTYHPEHEMLRYIHKLQSKDLSLVHSMISLGSCTMKLNATTEMIPVTWAEFGSLHPFTPKSQTEGYEILLGQLNDWLTEITGFAGMSLQPNSGAQGEYAGLMVIRQFHLSNGHPHRNIALIPSSAHGTNPASAVMAGMKVVIVACDEKGNIDVKDLEKKAQEYSDSLAVLMVTYPSTHGVYEEGIRKICQIIHSHGGQVYMDGANMNAQVGLTSPAMIGADVCHLNLHKTFCIPHGGGGPGMGPIGVAAHLMPFLPGAGENAVKAISSAFYGSASILPISHAYIAMMGSKGLTEATKYAILNANYIAKRLEMHYPILYKGSYGRNAHELIIDCRSFKKVRIEVEDIAKRLMDYGYHAPTVSFPVAGTMMIEPTESESKKELDRFCDVMIEIRKEISEIESGQADQNDNVLKNAPHTQRAVISSDWAHPYSREKAAFPMDHLRFSKFWPAVSRIDSAYGDRNLICSCIPVEEYSEAAV